MHERTVALTERQPEGRFEYEYDRGPYPLLVTITKVVFSPRATLVGEAVKEVIEGFGLIVSCKALLAIVRRLSVTVQVTVTVAGEV